MYYNANNIRVGHVIEFNGDPCKVLTATHITPGKGNAVMQIKMRNLKTGIQTESRFRATEQVKRAFLDTVVMEYLYEDGEMAHFMDQATYEQRSFPLEEMREMLGFVLPNTTVQMQVYQSEVVGIDLPKVVELKVVECAPYIKGATVTNQTKPATLETGLVIQVPGFIEPDQMIRVDTETGEYMERVKS